MIYFLALYSSDFLSPPLVNGDARRPVCFSICRLNRSSPNTQARLIELRISSSV